MRAGGKQDDIFIQLIHNPLRLPAKIGISKASKYHEKSLFFDENRVLLQFQAPLSAKMTFSPQSFVWSFSFGFGPRKKCKRR